MKQIGKDHKKKAQKENKLLKSVKEIWKKEPLWGKGIWLGVLLLLLLTLIASSCKLDLS